MSGDAYGDIYEDSAPSGEDNPFHDINYVTPLAIHANGKATVKAAALTGGKVSKTKSDSRGEQRRRQTQVPQKKQSAKITLSPADEEFFTKATPTDYGNALCVERLYSGRFAINKALGLLYYDGKRWTTENAEATLSDAIVSTLTQRGHLALNKQDMTLLRKCILDNRVISACKARFKDLPGIYTNVSAFDSYPHLLNCKNGIVDLRTGVLIPHASEWFLTQYIDYEYKPDAPQDVWLDFLCKVIDGFKDADKVIAKYVKSLAGYSITGETREQFIVYLLGKKGRNGKGTVVDVLQALLAGYATGCSFTTLTRKRDGNDQGFDIAHLREARLVVTSESGKEDKLNEAKVKELTGQDTLTVAHKGKDPFSFKPNFKIWALSNHEPKGDVDDDAFWSRIKIINFPYSYAGQEDKGLRERLIQPEVLEGVLAWLVEGAKAWYTLGNKGIQTPDKLRQLVQDARDKQDSVRQWVKEDCIIGETVLFYESRKLYAAYEKWCREEEVDDSEIKNYDAFTKRLSKMGYEKDKKRDEYQKERRGYKGIRPREPHERKE